MHAHLKHLDYSIPECTIISGPMGSCEMAIQVFQREPASFSRDFLRGSCLVEVDEGDGVKILLCQLPKHDGSKWCTPARKVLPRVGVRRPVRVKVASLLGCGERSLKMTIAKTLFVKSSASSFVHIFFRIRLDYRPGITNPYRKLQAFKWVSPEQALEEDLVGELHDCLKLIYKLP